MNSGHEVAKTRLEQLRIEPFRWFAPRAGRSIGPDDNVKVHETSALQLCDLEVVELSYSAKLSF
jgi:hypothetical protein